MCTVLGILNAVTREHTRTGGAVIIIIRIRIIRIIIRIIRIIIRIIYYLIKRKQYKYVSMRCTYKHNT